MATRWAAAPVARPLTPDTRQLTPDYLAPDTRTEAIRECILIS
jgi:hypothetical protein